MKVIDLKEKCRSYGLKVSGRKKVLIERLVLYDMKAKDLALKEMKSINENEDIITDKSIKLAQIRNFPSIDNAGHINDTADNFDVNNNIENDNKSNNDGENDNENEF